MKPSDHILVHEPIGFFCLECEEQVYTSPHDGCVFHLGFPIHCSHNGGRLVEETAPDSPPWMEQKYSTRLGHRLESQK